MIRADIVQLKTNYTCNNRCIYCYYSVKHNDNIMNLNEIKNNLQYIKKNIQYKQQREMNLMSTMIASKSCLLLRAGIQ